MARGVKGSGAGDKAKTKNKPAKKEKIKAPVNSAEWYGKIIAGLLGKALAAGFKTDAVLASAKSFIKE